jgi:hypothetical protein
MASDASQREAATHQRIDQKPLSTGWPVQDKNPLNFPGIASVIPLTGRLIDG